jgi:diacylglycerol O-acyltransferase / wax synthase
MPAPRLSALDASFLEVEGPTAHMHVGWAAVFAPRADGRSCSFEELREHLVGRLDRAPRYRQKLTDVPLGAHEPVWVDDEDFDARRHVRRARSPELGEVVDEVMSVPLDRDRPLWEMWIAERLTDGRVGLVGKAHHCMVDGLAAVELSALLLDPTAEDSDASDDSWEPTPAPGWISRLTRGVVDRVGEELEIPRSAGQLLRSPRQAVELPLGMARAAWSVAGSVFPLAPGSILNREGSRRRHLVALRRPLDELREIKRAFGTTVNDVLLAASAGAIRGFAAERGDEPAPLKTMVPVNVRAEEEGGLGNRISFMFVVLPCNEPDPVRRLLAIHAEAAEGKERGAPEHSDTALRAVGYLPRPLQRLVSHLVASPRMFNLVVSNIPGPRERLYLHGCELQEAYPIVPLAERHGLSIGMTTIQENACFGLYADPRVVPDVDRLAGHLDAAVDELLELSAS